jgi:drug/metabolite transporter (DMT)-like permease
MVLLCVVLFSSIGDVMLARGMKQVGEIHVSNLGSVILALANPWVAVGICFLLVFFASYLTALSWADLTFVLPATAFSYVVVAFLARTLLQEQISFQRWAGIMLVVAGVGFVAGGPSRTKIEARTEDKAHPPVAVANPELAEVPK